MELKEQIISQIGKIVDKDLDIALSDLNSILEVNINETTIQVYIELIQPIQWIYSQVKAEVKIILDKEAPHLKHEIFINEKPLNYNRTVLPRVKNIIAVASGKGGVGKSSIAANLAAGLMMQGANVGILDADVYGPSQPTMFGLENQKLMAVQKEDGTTVAIPHEQYGVKVGSMGFIMNREDAAIVRGPMLASYFNMLLEQVEWGDLDFLVIDLPPGTGDIQLTLVQRVPLNGAVIITTPQDIALADVRRSIAMFHKVKVEILGIVENMSYFSPPELPENKYFIFGEGGGRKIAEEFGVKLLAEIPLDLQMREGNDSGKPVILNSDKTPYIDALNAMVLNIVREVRLNNFKSLNGVVPEISL